MVLLLLLQQSCFVIGVNAAMQQNPCRSPSLFLSSPSHIASSHQKSYSILSYLGPAPLSSSAVKVAAQNAALLSLPFALRRPENSAPTFIPHYITWFLVGGFLSHRSVGSWQSAKFSWSPWCNSLTRGKRSGYDGCKIMLCLSGTAISTCEPQRGVKCKQ